MKRFGRTWEWWLALMLIVVGIGSVSCTESARAQSADMLLPRSVQVQADLVAPDGVLYMFDITISDYKVINNMPQLRVAVSIVKNGGEQPVRIRDIVQHVAADASSLNVSADGTRFVLDASYPSDPNEMGAVRYVTTTFGKMFAGGRIGILARLAE